MIPLKENNCRFDRTGTEDESERATGSRPRGAKAAGEARVGNFHEADESLLPATRSIVDRSTPIWWGGGERKGIFVLGSGGRDGKRTKGRQLDCTSGELLLF